MAVEAWVVPYTAVEVPHIFTARRNGYDRIRAKKLVGIAEERLRQQLCTETNPKAVKRLIVVLLSADGFSPDEIKRFPGIPAQTV